MRGMEMALMVLQIDETIPTVGFQLESRWSSNNYLHAQKKFIKSKHKNLV